MMTDPGAFGSRDAVGCRAGTTPGGGPFPCFSLPVVGRRHSARVTAGRYLGPMQPPIPNTLRKRAAQWEDLTRWERAEVGRALRGFGWSYPEIRTLIPVPKSTLSGWCSTVELSPEQIEAIRKRAVSAKGVPRDTQWRRRLEIVSIRKAARGDVRRLVVEPLWVAGTTMYWAEGSKTSRRLALTNSDPAALRLFRRWTERYLDSKAAFVLALHLHHGNDEAAAKTYWSEVLELPDADYHKSFIKPPGTGQRKNHLAHGVCRITVRRSSDHLETTLAWIQGLAAYLASEPSSPAILAPGR